MAKFKMQRMERLSDLRRSAPEREEWATQKAYTDAVEMLYVDGVTEFKAHVDKTRDDEFLYITWIFEIKENIDGIPNQN